jgi:phosphoglycerate dehydrogenase-like enzyme
MAAQEETDLWQILFTDAGEFAPPDDYIHQARTAGLAIVKVHGHDPDEIAAYGATCRGLILFRARVDAALLDRLPHCRILARNGTGYELIDVEAARQRGIMVTYVPDFCTDELAEHVMAFILAFARQFPLAVANGVRQHWMRAEEFPPMHRLSSRTLGILGFGRSGRRTAELARAFGMRVLVWTRTPRPELLAHVGAHAASFEEALGCHYVSIHVPLTEATRGLIGREALRHCSPETVLINISRGAVVDTGALVEALQAGRLAGAGLDVVTPAPLPSDHPLWRIPNVWLTSHSGAFSVESGATARSLVLEDLRRVRHGLPPMHPVPELQ